MELSLESRPGENSFFDYKQLFQNIVVIKYKFKEKFETKVYRDFIK